MHKKNIYYYDPIPSPRVLFFIGAAAISVASFIAGLFIAWLVN